MKIGDLVRFTPESWGTPLEDRPLYVVVREPYEISPHPERDKLMVDILLPGERDIYATGPETLELVSEVKTFI